MKEIIRKAPTSKVLNEAKPWTRSNCTVCGSLSTVMGFKKVGGKMIYCMVPFEPAPDAKLFVCGRCVAYGELTEGKIKSMKGRNRAEKLRAYVDAVEKKYPPHMVDYAEFRWLKQELALIEDVTEENLKSWRKARGMTQKKLGEILGVAQQTIGKVEKGERMIPVRWVRIMEKIHPTPT